MRIGGPIARISDRSSWLASTAIQRPLDCQADALCRRLGLPVGDMGVAQRHARPFVAEQAGDDRQRDGLAERRGSRTCGAGGEDARRRGFPLGRGACRSSRWSEILRRGGAPRECWFRSWRLSPWRWCAGTVLHTPVFAAASGSPELRRCGPRALKLATRPSWATPVAGMPPIADASLHGADSDRAGELLRIPAITPPDAFGGPYSAEGILDGFVCGGLEKAE